KQRLHNRLPHIDASCLRCPSVSEFALHALIFYPEIEEIWNRFSLKSVIPRELLLSPWQWWIALVASQIRQSRY
ncbi:hypothetical protein PIB30_082721, partial [Stylosanthes scabra]|nr:hypothetical protein [Stylosanthes scabra]